MVFVSEKRREQKRQEYQRNKARYQKTNHLWYLRNKERVKAAAALWKKSHPIRVKELARVGYFRHKQKYLEYVSWWRTMHKARYLKYQNQYRKLRYASNPQFKLQKILRRRLAVALSDRSHKSKSALKLVGCSLDALKLYLEKQFKPGMTWENHSFRGWHIDHKIPCAAFDLSKLSQQKQCFHYSNLQPLWAKQNHSKGAKVSPKGFLSATSSAS